MLLLHLSDIHFRSPDCGTPDTDPERPYRTRLLQDVRARTDTLGPVEAILVGGDIAFKGDPAEYNAAFIWFKELADACGCPLERVFMVPGNHDVDRSVITRTRAVRNVQQAILRAPPERRERELRDQLREEETGRALLAPLTAYNDFAKLFSCQVYPPDHLGWRQDLPLEGGVHLRVYGLTSTLLSGAGAPDSKDDNRDSLYLSPLQTVLDPVDDVVNLVMCHHPPDWLMDQEEVDDAIRAKAAIHLFGHKHRQRCLKDDQYVRFSAGAVNPDRQEAGWEPGYNLIKVYVRGQGRERVLHVEAHILQWQSNPDLFRRRITPTGSDVLQHTISIPGRARGVMPCFVTMAATTTPPDGTATVDVEAAMSDEGTRNLVLRFWNLTGSQRRGIALGLNLIEDSEMSLPEPERYGRALLRAAQRGILDKVAEEVKRLETR